VWDGVPVQCGTGSPGSSKKLLGKDVGKKLPGKFQKPQLFAMKNLNFLQRKTLTFCKEFLNFFP